MNFDKNNIYSMRFMPDWNRNSGTGIAGLIQLCFDIYRLDYNASKWVEIGSYIGESALIFASFEFVKQLNCVDPLTIKDRPDQEQCFKARLKYFMKKNNQKVFLNKQTSESYCKKVEDKSIDVVYIDGDHGYYPALKDLILWYPKIKSGGFLCGHDYMGKHEGVDQAVNEFVESKNLKVQQTYCDNSFMIRV